MTRHREPCTLRLTAKQAELLRGLLSNRSDPGVVGWFASNDATWRAILRKLEGKGTIGGVKKST